MIRRLGIVILLLATAGMAQAQQAFQPGVHYQTIVPAQPVDEAGMIEVVEVFSYACPHCASFQPFIHSWVEKAPENVSFRRVPVVFRASWEPFARAYYTAEALGVVDEAHAALFDALHKERRPLRSNEDIAEYLNEKIGLDQATYLKTAKSFGIETKLRRGMSQVQRFGVDATPSVVINGKYRATANMAGSVNKLLELMNHLVAMESETGGAAAAASSE